MSHLTPDESSRVNNHRQDAHILLGQHAYQKQATSSDSTSQYSFVVEEGDPYIIATVVTMEDEARSIELSARTNLTLFMIGRDMSIE
jgi:hypothetical protein